MAIIEVHRLTRKFGDFTAVKDVSLQVEEGEVLGLLGPNGAGKTTTIRMLSGIIAPTSGYAVVAGERTDGNIEKLHEVIGLLTEAPGFYERLSAHRNLAYFAGFYPINDINSQIERYLRVMGLGEWRDSRVSTFSKGMKQRLAIARALIHEPKVLFLDEPTAGLDPEVAGEVRELIRKLAGEGRTIFLSTHNLSEAEALCHRIAVVKTSLLAIDTPQNLNRRFFRRRVIVRLETVSEAVIEAMRALPFVENFDRQDDQLLIEISEPDKNLPELVKRIVQGGGEILAVSEEKHTLEEVYLTLMQESKAS